MRRHSLNDSKGPRQLFVAVWVGGKLVRRSPPLPLPYAEPILPEAHQNLGWVFLSLSGKGRQGPSKAWLA